MFLTLLFFSISLVFGVLGQGSSVCVSEAVTNLTVQADRLVWNASINCNVSFYIVHVIDEDDIIFHFESATPFFNISFLPICELFRFIVTPITTQNVQGAGATVSSKVRPPTDANFSLTALNITSTGRNTVLLDWRMPEDQRRCIDLFRVVIWEADNAIPRDIYVEDTYYNFTSAVPCTSYQFGVRAIYNPEEDEPIYLRNFTFPGSPPNPPVLRTLQEGITTVNMTWVLQSYAQNRCPITAINIDASPLFNVSHAIDDTPERQPVAFQLINLQPNTIYLSLVSVVNTIGSSPPLTIAIQTHPNTSSYDEYY